MQRLVGSVGVEALPDWLFRKQSFDKYCGVNCMRRDRPRGQLFPTPARLKGQRPFILNATPQKSFGLREAIIHTRLTANSEHPYVKLVNRAVACADCRTKWTLF